MKKFIIVVVILAVALGVYLDVWCNRTGHGIHALGKNVALIEGECVMINWDASEDEAYKAMEAWVSMRAEK